MRHPDVRIPSLRRPYSQKTHDDAARRHVDARRTAFEAVFTRHHAAVLRFVQRRVDDRERAEELAMDCFEIAWRRFDPAAPFELPWLLQTARNLVGTSYRRRDRERAGLEHLAGAVRESGGADDLERLEVRLAMEALRPADREVLQLVYWDGLSADEAAEVLGCRTAAVWKRLSRARSALRKRLEPEAASPARFPEKGVSDLALD